MSKLSFRFFLIAVLFFFLLKFADRKGVNHIMIMIYIDTIDNPIISEFKSLRKLRNDNSQLSEEQNNFICEGNKAITRLFSSNIKVLKLLCTEEYYKLNEEAIANKSIENVIIASEELLREIIGFKMHQGIIALAEEPAKAKLSQLDDKIIVANNIFDSENIGSIVRNGAAFGLSSLIYDNESASPYLRRAVRVSMGNIFSFKHYHSQDLVRDLITLKKQHNYAIISAEVTDSAVYLDEYDFPIRSAIVFGNEGKGIDNEIIDISDDVVKIRINESINSINVAAATSVFFYEISKIKSNARI